jgi:hypothetical protein
MQYYKANIMNSTILEKFLNDPDCKENMINNPNLLSQIVKFKGSNNNNIMHLICKTHDNEILMREILSTNNGKKLILEENEYQQTPLCISLHHRECRYFNMMIATKEGKRAFKMIPNTSFCKIFKLTKKPPNTVLNAVKRHIQKYGITFSPSGSFSRFINRYSANIDSSFLGEDSEVINQREIDKVLNKICERMSKK